ncbi:16501_t:CDS:2, partial [Gigaspora margarita]
TFDCAKLNYKEGKKRNSPENLEVKLALKRISLENPAIIEKHQREVEKDKAKAYKVEAYKVKKDETKAYEVEVDKKKDEINKKDNEDLEVVNKTAKMDYVDRTFESSFETSINVGRYSEKQSDLESCFQSGISICRSKEIAFKLDLGPIRNGSLDNLKSIKESINKGIRMGKNNNINQGFGYLLMNWPFTPIFDPRKYFHSVFKLR